MSNENPKSQPTRRQFIQAAGAASAFAAMSLPPVLRGEREEHLASGRSWVVGDGEPGPPPTRFR